MDPLFLRQVWSGNEALRQKLEADKSVVGRQRLHYFVINKGPWSRIDSWNSAAVNYLTDLGVIEVNEQTGTFSINDEDQRRRCAN